MTKSMRKFFAVMAVGCLLMGSVPVQAWSLRGFGISSIMPKIKALGTRIVHSRYFKPIVGLAALVTAGYIGYKSDSTAPGVPTPPPGPLPRLGVGMGADGTIVYPVPGSHPSAQVAIGPENAVQQPRQTTQIPETHWYDRFYDEGFLRTGNIKIGSQELEGREIVIEREGATVRVQQPLVLNQMQPRAGGGASCGYQALKNGRAIWGLVSGSDDAGTARDLLTSPEVAQRMFGLGQGEGEHVGPWRLSVQQGRVNSVLKHYINTRLQLVPHAALKTVVDGVERERRVEVIDYAGYLFRDVASRYQNLREAYARSIVAEAVAGRPQQFSGDAFVQWIQNLTLQNFTEYMQIDDPAAYAPVRPAGQAGDQPVERQQILERLKQHMGSAETVSRYFNLENMQTSFMCSIDILGQVLDQVNIAALSNHTFRPMPLSGEWIHEGEIRELVAQLRQENPAIGNVPVTVIDDVDPQHVGEEVQAIHQAIVNGNALQDPVQIFLLGTMRHIGDGGTAGHWITLVLDARNMQDRRYIVTDSLNTLRLTGRDNNPCHRLIQMLEGQEVVARCVPGAVVEDLTRLTRVERFARRVSRWWDKLDQWLDE